MENLTNPEQVFGVEHTINQTKIDCQPALDRDEARVKEEEERKRKVFIGGLPKNLPDSDLSDYFQQFGEVQKAYVVKDPKTGKTRGFGFVIFKEIESYEKALAQEDHQIHDKDIVVKRS